MKFGIVKTKITSVGILCNFLYVVLIVVLICGCAHRQFGSPRMEPAPLNIQQQRAARFDPYPDPNIGPEIPGARPSGFETPSPERCTPTKISTAPQP